MTVPQEQYIPAQNFADADDNNGSFAQNWLEGNNAEDLISQSLPRVVARVPHYALPTNATLCVTNAAKSSKHGKLRKSLGYLLVFGLGASLAYLQPVVLKHSAIDLANGSDAVAQNTLDANAETIVNFDDLPEAFTDMPSAPFLGEPEHSQLFEYDSSLPSDVNERYADLNQVGYDQLGVGYTVASNAELYPGVDGQSREVEMTAYAPVEPQLNYADQFLVPRENDVNANYTVSNAMTTASSPGGLQSHELPGANGNFTGFGDLQSPPAVSAPFNQYVTPAETTATQAPRPTQGFADYASFGSFEPIAQTAPENPTAFDAYSNNPGYANQVNQGVLKNNVNSLKNNDSFENYNYNTDESLNGYAEQTDNNVPSNAFAPAANNYGATTRPAPRGGFFEQTQSDANATEFIAQRYDDPNVEAVPQSERPRQLRW
ncbi:MAG: hypothetical protein Q4G03_06095 [Planctomycetia bacterium]|nr:hypothetical protein [Planctomycetia bacterium]